MQQENFKKIIDLCLLGLKVHSVMRTVAQIIARMKTAPIIGELQSEPIIGEMYRVPYIMAKCFPRARATDGRETVQKVPILGLSHNDKEYGFGEFEHYHYDVRFLFPHQFETLEKLHIKWSTEGILSWVLPKKDVVVDTIRFEAFVCRRPMPHFGASKKSIVHLFQDRFKDRKLDTKKPVCQHRGVSLGSFPCVNDCVICPAHGLAWNKKTGANIQRPLISSQDEFFIARKIRIEDNKIQIIVYPKKAADISKDNPLEKPIIAPDGFAEKYRF